MSNTDSTGQAARFRRDGQAFETYTREDGRRMVRPIDDVGDPLPVRSGILDRPRSRPSKRTAWVAVIVVALVALLAAVLFYAKQSRDREDRITSDYACAMQADAAGASSWQIVDGRCVTS